MDPYGGFCDPKASYIREKRIKKAERKLLQR